MRSLNHTVSLFLFLLINIVRVTLGDLQNCIDELLVEFRNRKPLDDFLIAYLNIKYISVDYSRETGNNEELYRGNYDLTFAARGYYLDMYYILQDLDLPLLLSPQSYCRTQHEDDEDDCIHDIANIGCKANDDGVDCLKYLYVHWKHTVQPATIPDTVYVSDKRLLEAIYRGSDKFRDLSKENLIEVLSRRPKVIKSLSDENLLRESGFETREIIDSHVEIPRFEVVSFEKYHEFLNYTRHHYEYSYNRSGGAKSYDFDEYRNYTIQPGLSDNDAESSSSSRHAVSSFNDQFYSREYHNFMNYKKYREYNEYVPEFGAFDIDIYKDYVQYMDFMQYLKYNDEYNSDSEGDLTNEDDYRQYMINQERRQMEIEMKQKIAEDRNRQIRENAVLRENHLRNARFERYGVKDASYIDICNEYIRRKNTSRSFDYYYTMYIYDTIKDSSIGSVFQSCTDYCVKYVAGQQ